MTTTLSTPPAEPSVGAAAGAAARMLSRGRLEVETDLLLGVDSVLLPLEWAERDAGAPFAAPSARVKDPVGKSGNESAVRRFDAELFAARRPLERTTPRTSDSAAAPTSRRSLESIPPVSEPASRGVAIPIVDRIVPPAGATKSERLAALATLHARECPHCTTATGYENIVFGEGNPDAELFFVGEAPGETEDRAGRPFVGRAGEKLDEMIAAMGLTRAEVYIANVLKARPPENRTPLAHEVERCGPYLLAQLAVVRPRVVVTLGGPATKLLLASELGITRLRGIWANVRLGAAGGEPLEVPVMPTFHPAYLLRNYTAETRRQVWEDLKKVLDLLGRPVPQRAKA